MGTIRINWKVVIFSFPVENSQQTRKDNGEQIFPLRKPILL